MYCKGIYFLHRSTTNWEIDQVIESLFGVNDVHRNDYIVLRNIALRSTSKCEHGSVTILDDNNFQNATKDLDIAVSPC